MTPTPTDLTVMVIAGLLAVVLVAYVAREISRSRRAKQQGGSDERRAMALLRDCGPLFAWELRRFGVEDADAVLEQLAWNQYVVSSKAEDGVLWALSEAGRRAIRKRG